MEYINLMVNSMLEYLLINKIIYRFYIIMMKKLVNNYFLFNRYESFSLEIILRCFTKIWNFYIRIR